jgi:hypothetical protein
MKHLVKRGAVKPTADQLDNWQLGFDYVSGDLYIKNPNAVSGDQIVNIGGNTLHNDISGEISAISGYINQVNDTISDHILNDSVTDGDNQWTTVTSGVLSLTNDKKDTITNSIKSAQFVSGYLRLTLNDDSTQDVNVIIDEGEW